MESGVILSQYFSFSFYKGVTWDRLLPSPFCTLTKHPWLIGTYYIIKPKSINGKRQPHLMPVPIDIDDDTIIDAAAQLTMPQNVYHKRHRHRHRAYLLRSNHKSYYLLEYIWHFIDHRWSVCTIIGGRSARYELYIKDPNDYDHHHPSSGIIIIIIILAFQHHSDLDVSQERAGRSLYCVRGQILAILNMSLVRFSGVVCAIACCRVPKKDWQSEGRRKRRANVR